MRILGIDPGLATVGIGILERGRNEKLTLLDYCTIETTKGMPRALRLQELLGDLQKLLKEWKPDLAVLEKLYFQKNVKTAIDVAEARGVILLTLAEEGIEVLEPTPSELKLAITGDGKADKLQMRDMLCHLLHVEKDAFSGERDDTTDAIALGVYGALSSRLTALTEAV
jgi:crossover junction endodeoxyribonuclease RuvC